MTSSIEFETPENIRVAYEPAGLGTRYVAWIIDCILLWFLMIVILIGALILGFVTDATFRQVGEFFQDFDKHSQAKREEQVIQFLQYFVGIAILALGLGSFAYFTCSELWLRGQSYGKRVMGLRVVRIDGFSLDASGIFVRNVFRIVDQLPPLWVVMFLSKRSQRLGDMVAGTTVIVDRPEKLSDIRQKLAEIPVVDVRFQFDAIMLKRARPEDFVAIEKVLERWASLPADQQEKLLAHIVPPLVERLKSEQPANEERVVFLQELLAAEYRRQHRNL